MPRSPRRVRRRRRRGDRPRCPCVAPPRDPPPGPPRPGRASGRGQRALGREARRQIWEIVNEPEGGVIELGGGIDAQVEAGHVRFTTGPAAEPAAATLPVPGAAASAAGRSAPSSARASRGGVARPRGARPGALGGALVVRSWREGDRMRPLGLGGSSRCRTSSPTARSRGRCGRRCPWSPPMSASSGSRASPSPRSSPRGPAPARPRSQRGRGPDRPEIDARVSEDAISEMLVSEEDLQRRVAEMAQR